MIGVFVSLDLFLFYVFWEVVLVPMYVMIGVWGGVDTHPRGDQVLPLHDGRLDADARGHGLPGVDATSSSPASGRGTTSRSPAWCSRCANATLAALASPQGLCFWAFSHRLLHQGADVAGAHLAARRARAGAHGRLGDPRRGDAQARHLRLPALLDGPLPGHGVAGRRQPGRRRHPRRRPLRRARSRGSSRT